MNRNYGDSALILTPISPAVPATFTYDDLGRRTGVTRGNGATTSYSYDDAQRLETLTHDFAGTADDQTLSFVRNPLSQIMTRTGSNAAFDWDDYVAASTSYGVNGLNQVTSIGAIAVSFDGRGNLVADGAKTYAYDVENRLTAVSGGGTLAYDPLSRLYEVSDGVTATKFLTDGADVIAEYDAAGSTLLRRYVHGPGMDEPLVWYEGSGTTDRCWLAADERGSVIAVSDDTGAAIAKNTYDEFGMPAAGNQGRFQYTGQMWLPEVGLYHYKSRTYAPGIGRFLQADPIGYAAGMNLYAYVGNDPVNFVDPFGLKWSCQTVDGEEVCTFIDGGGGGGYSGGGGSGEGPGGVFGPPVDDTIVVIGQPIEINIPTMPITLSGGGRGAGGPKGDEEIPDWYKKEKEKERRQACADARETHRLLNYAVGVGAVVAIYSIVTTGPVGGLVAVLGFSVVLYYHELAERRVKRACGNVPTS